MEAKQSEYWLVEECTQYKMCEQWEDQIVIQNTF